MERERVAGRRETRPASPQEWGAVRGGVKAPEWRKTPGGITGEWEGESSCQRALTPLEWNIFLGG